jgi:hypothetical protein
MSRVLTVRIPINGRLNKRGACWRRHSAAMLLWQTGLRIPWALEAAAGLARARHPQGWRTWPSEYCSFASPPACPYLSL